MGATLLLVLAHIACAESSFQPVKLHPDCASYGYFGLTETACAEVGEAWPPETKEDELRAATKYLELMNKRFKCNGNYWKAAEYYHGGSEEQREEYARKLAKMNSLTVVNEFDKLFGGVVKASKVDKLTAEIAEEYANADSLQPCEVDAAIAKLENRVLQLSDEIRELKNRIKNQRRESNEI